MKYVHDSNRKDGVLYSFIPFAMMGLTNIAIYKFIQAKLTNKRHGKTKSINQALANVAMRGTAILITVTIVTGPPGALLFDRDQRLH